MEHNQSKKQSRLFARTFLSSTKTNAHDKSTVDPDLWPKDWTTIFYKTYNRFSQLPLPSITAASALQSCVAKRVSTRTFSGAALSLRELATLLQFSCGEVSDEDATRRAQPSAGARYPIETYIIVLQPSDELEQGIYHYNIAQHALERLQHSPYTPADAASLFTDVVMTDASMLVVLTGVFWRSADKYGGRGYRFTLIEAGHIGQNMYLHATEAGLHCVALGGVDEEAIERALVIDGERESVVYALAVGK